MNFFHRIVFISFLTNKTFAADQSFINIIASFKSLDNLSHEPETPPAKYPGHQELDISINLKPAWQLQIIYGEANYATYSFAGAGFRIKTPGYFLIGTTKEDGNLKKKRTPIDTSVHAELLKMYDHTDPNISTQYFISRAGFTLDWVPIKKNPLFIHFDISTMIIRSDMFISSGVGLGLEF